MSDHPQPGPRQVANDGKAFTFPVSQQIRFLRIGTATPTPPAATA